MATGTHQPAGAGYLELLRGNVNYRRLWIGDVASHLGDWFNVIAVYTLVERLTGSPLALGLVFITKSLPFALASPLAGLIADRFDRRRLMIGADVARAAIVLGLVFVREPHHVPWIYVLGGAQMVVSALYIPARSASIPNVTTHRELLTANALSSATWSTLLAVGAALGGFATAWIGERAVFVVNSATYLVSALFILRTRIPQQTEPGSKGPLISAVHRDLMAGWREMIKRPEVGRMAFAKSAWAIGGGGLVYSLALLGQGLLPGAPSMGIGWLYAARGVGTGLGPLATRAWLPRSSSWSKWIGVWILASGVFYSAVGWVGWTIPVLLVLVTLAHATSGANWVASTTLLQERTDDRFRGRIFATEWLSLTFIDSAAILLTSFVLESGVVDLRGAVRWLAGVQIATGVAWLLWIAPAERRYGRARAKDR